MVDRHFDEGFSSFSVDLTAKQLGIFPLYLECIPHTRHTPLSNHLQLNLFGTVYEFFKPIESMFPSTLE